MTYALDNNIDKAKILDTLEENGITYYPEYENSLLDMDSMTFISVIVSLENNFQIEISDKFLGYIPITYQEFMKFAIDAITYSKQLMSHEQFFYGSKEIIT